MWQQEQNLACPGCGQPRDEVWVWDTDEQDVKQAQWDAHLRLCVACQKRDQVEHQFRSHPHAQTAGIWPSLVRVDPARPADD